MHRNVLCHVGPLLKYPVLSDQLAAAKTQAKLVILIDHVCQKVHFHPSLLLDKLSQDMLDFDCFILALCPAKFLAEI